MSFMTPMAFRFPVIAPLVARHAEDVAFYWLQMNNARFSTRFGIDKLQHFDRSQAANSAGLKVAGVESLRACGSR